MGTGASGINLLLFLFGGLKYPRVALSSRLISVNERRLGQLVVFSVLTAHQVLCPEPRVPVSLRLRRQQNRRTIPLPRPALWSSRLRCASGRGAFARAPTARFFHPAVDESEPELHQNAHELAPEFPCCVWKQHRRRSQALSLGALLPRPARRQAPRRVTRMALVVR